ncbi:hypothetical protein IEQ34_022732 [Dendrobium chrysotoxum]|uniref:Uncharacterized protein n=1 Tax=Dendrobium chrysotoxum TaxID=161865 RepID=A0AAV7FYJ3_DENCH|nr:hypothetical protein IEQ34_022732 [Dendrobium chrysotoxum]
MALMDILVNCRIFFWNGYNSMIDGRAKNESIVDVRKVFDKMPRKFPNSYSVLPNDDWFVDIAQENISKISGKARMGNGERDLNSPTASVSTMSNGSS